MPYHLATPQYIKVRKIINLSYFLFYFYILFYIHIYYFKFLDFINALTPTTIPAITAPPNNTETIIIVPV